MLLTTMTRTLGRSSSPRSRQVITEQMLWELVHHSQKLFKLARDYEKGYL